MTFGDLRPLLDEQWETFDGNLSLTIRVEARGDGVFARGEFWVRPHAICSRCAADVAYDLHETFLAAYAPEGKKDVQFEDGVLFDASKPPVWYPLPSEKIDLAEAFGEALLFALPNYPRCQDDCEVPEKWRATEELAENADKKTAEDTDAEPKAIDPRFQKLQEIRDAMGPGPTKTKKASTKTANPSARGANGETSNDKTKG